MTRKRPESGANATDRGRLHQSTSPEMGTLIPRKSRAARRYRVPQSAGGGAERDRPAPGPTRRGQPGCPTAPGRGRRRPPCGRPLPRVAPRHRYDGSLRSQPRSLRAASHSRQATMLAPWGSVHATGLSSRVSNQRPEGHGSRGRARGRSPAGPSTATNPNTPPSSMVLQQGRGPCTSTSS